MVLETKTNSLNSDLVWNLDKIKKRQLAIDFIKKFEGKFCVYSSSVEQFYTNYTMNFLSGESTKMVILPNPYAFHDTFNGINDDAIIETGLNIIPGETLNRQGLYLMISYKNQPGRATPIPLKPALQKMLNTRRATDPFLPMLAKGDLREFNDSMPCLHLHRVKLSNLEGISDFERSSVKEAIFDKLSELIKVVDSL
mgnify:FL=1|jgi:hypothetical protein